MAEVPLDDTEKSSAAPERINAGQVNEQHEQKLTATPVKRTGVRRLLALIGLGLAIIIAAGLVAYRYYVLYEPAKTPDQPISVTHVDTDQQLAKFLHPATGETWLDMPQTLPDQKFFISFGDGSPPADYYLVGHRYGSDIILGVTEQVADYLVLFEKAQDGTVTALQHPDANTTLNLHYVSQFKDQFAADVKVDTATRYDSVSIPTKLSIDHNQAVTVSSEAFGSDDLGQRIQTTGDSDARLTVVRQLGSSQLVRIERTYADTHLTTIYYALDTPFHSRIVLTYQPITKDLADYTWDNGVSVPKTDTNSNYKTSLIAGIVRGCGSSGYSVSRSDAVTDSDFVVAGKTPDHQTVYAFKDETAMLVQKAYQEYKDYYTGTDGVTVVSQSDFVKQHALVAYKNKAGEWLIYTRDQYAPLGGCAKPVIYLYPTHPEPVTVKVGADVRISDPLYDVTTGWQVWARPDGSLTANGHSYNSLFWEGPGIGMYPAISAGTMIPRAQAVDTIKAQLAQQGLTAKESSDFLAYWSDKIPEQPYIRLTWFTTSQINELAPLHISPKPDTLIRVFLDMQGYNEPITLPSQHLQAVSRNGFTAVEWGGLSHQKLY